MGGNVRTALKGIGPGFIIASVVLGPGSITVSSKIGSEYGYSLLWVVVLAAIGMGIYTMMSARYGVSHEKSILQAIAETCGRWLAVLIGLSAFLTASSFQFGNNLGVATALQSLTGIEEYVWPLVFTPSAIILVLFAKNLYKVLEKLMMVLVMLMIFAFVTNLVFAGPNLLAVLKGFIPLSVPTGGLHVMAALIGTTFVLHVCLYQSYLVQNKGWRAADLAKGKIDTLAGVFILAAISILVIMTSGAALHPRSITVSTAADMAIQLEALFGTFAKFIFSIGLWAAAFSSLLVNAVMAGGLLADGLGLGRSMEYTAPKIFTVLAMLVGMVIAVFFRGDVVYALVLAQASSLFAVPSIGIGLFLVLNNKKIMGRFRNTAAQNIVAIFALVLILLMVYYMYHRLISFLGNL